MLKVLVDHYLFWELGFHMTEMQKSLKSFTERMTDLIHSQVGGPELVRALVRIRCGTLEQIYEAVTVDNPKLSLRRTQLFRVLVFFIKHGIIFRNTTKVYHPTTLAHGFVWNEEDVDWLPSACMAIAIITESRPGTDIVKTLAKELNLDERQAKTVLGAFEGAFKGLIAKWLASKKD